VTTKMVFQQYSYSILNKKMRRRS